MNYIDLINNFWRFYDENKNDLNPSDIVLYKVILRYCNKIGWVNPFTINPYLMADINPLSQNTYYKSFKRLHDLKLIEWVKGKHNVSNQQVTILNIKVSTNASINNSIDNSIKFSVGDSLSASVGNNNKTIIQLNNETIKQLEQKDFDFLINSKEFTKFLIKSKLFIKKIESTNGKEKDLGFNYQKFIFLFNEITNRNFKGDSKSESAFNQRIQKYNEAEFGIAIRNAFKDDYLRQNPKYLTPEYITRENQIEKWLNSIEGEKPKEQTKNKIHDQDTNFEWPS